MCCKLASKDKISGFLDSVNLLLNDFSNKDKRRHVGPAPGAVDGEKP